MKKKISEILSQISTLPVLFVGSGLTRRYLGSPDWEGLLRKFCADLSNYEYYYDKARRNCTESEMILPKTASYIEDDFNELWYKSNDYSKSRSKHLNDIQNKISPLKLCIADYFQELSDSKDPIYTKSVNLSKEVDLLKQIGAKNISCIITTNYDLFLEKTFGTNNFTTYIGQDQLLFSAIYEIAEIYKIHGSCKMPDSIIINHNDYERFIKKNSYLSAKILTLFLEHPIIFLGYGIKDPNIIRILQSITECLEDEQLKLLKNRLIFIEWNKNGTEEVCNYDMIFNNGNSITMTKFSLSDFSQIYQAILDNPVKYDVKALRRIKSQLYELVKENKPGEKLYIDTNIEDDKSDIEFVVGVGVYESFGKVGYQGVEAEDIFSYVIGKSDKTYDNDALLELSIPRLCSKRVILPICKLISSCSNDNSINIEVKKLLKNNFEDFLTTSQKDTINKHGYTKINSLMQYYSKNKLKTLNKIPLMDPQEIDIDDLYSFICEVLKDEPDILDKKKPHKLRSQFKKCINIWDWLKFSDAAKQKIQKKV